MAVGWGGSICEKRLFCLGSFRPGLKGFDGGGLKGGFSGDREFSCLHCR